MLNDIRESEGNRREWIVEVLKDIDGMHTGYLHKGELVRCKECKYWDTHTMQFAENNLIIARCKQWLQYSRMNGYCHNGERKESE